jgi:hypothetical protein
MRVCTVRGATAHASSRGARVTPMSRSMTAPRRALLALASAACLAFACAGLSASALGAGAVHYQRESLSALQGQLHNHEVKALGFHPAPGSGHIHASLNDGRHMTISYASTEQAQLVAQAQAQGAQVTIAKAKATAAKKPVHHKLRYIAGGILIVVIVVVAAVLLVDRRRKLNQAGRDAPAAPSSGEAG